jgi:hypothetical protein
MKAIEGTSRFAQPNHLPRHLWQQDAPAPPPAPSAYLGQVSMNLWSHSIERIPLMLSIK